MVRRMFFSLSLAAATIFSAQAAVVRGVVEDNGIRANPIAGAVVSLTSTAAGTAVQYRDTTDTNGAYRITITENGTYDISVKKTGYTESPDNDPSVKVTTATGSVVEDLIMIPRPVGVTVSGAVTDSLSNAFLVGVKLFLEQSAAAGWKKIDSTVSGASGAYSFDSIAAGTYRIESSLKGYVTKTIGITVKTTAQTVDIKLVAIETAKISGTITDSLTNANLTGALLILEQRTSSGWRSMDSASSAAGAYAFDSIAAGTYRIQASLTGYISITTASITIAGTTPQIVNIKLLAKQTGSITGKVTADSAKGAAISGATVILEQVSGTAVAIDTTVTDANGIYGFSAIETGLNYDITASKTGFTEKTVRHNRQAAGTDTVNITLPKIATGDIFVKVVKQTDSAAIAEATVTISATGGTLVTATAGSNGIAGFTDLAVSTYSLTVSAAGFIPVNRTGFRLDAHAKDTLLFYLATATGGTKVLVGTVIDSSSKTVLAGARVTLTLQSDVAGGSLVLIDSTDATGKFSISGIPASIYLGSVSAIRSGYRNYGSSQITIGQPNQADTAKLTMTMVKLLTQIRQSAHAAAIPGKQEISVAGPARLAMRNFSENGVFSLFSMNGKLVFRTEVTPHTTMLSLPQGVKGGMYVVALTQKNTVFRRQVLMP